MNYVQSLKWNVCAHTYLHVCVCCVHSVCHVYSRKALLCRAVHKDSGAPRVKDAGHVLCAVCVRMCVCAVEPLHWSTTKPPWTQWGNYRLARCYRAARTLITRPSTSDAKSPVSLLCACKDTHIDTQPCHLCYCYEKKNTPTNDYAAHNKVDKWMSPVATVGSNPDWSHVFEWCFSVFLK